MSPDPGTPPARQLRGMSSTYDFAQDSDSLTSRMTLEPLVHALLNSHDQSSESAFAIEVGIHLPLSSAVL
jgi:hypothetical protein